MLDKCRYTETDTHKGLDQSWRDKQRGILESMPSRTQQIDRQTLWTSDIAGWPGAQGWAESLGSLRPLEALGSPLLSWSQATSFYLDLEGEEGSRRVLQLGLGLESSSGQVGAEDILMGSNDWDSDSEDLGLGRETELIPSSPPEAQPGSGLWGHPRLPGCTEFVTVTAFPGFLMSC